MVSRRSAQARSQPRSKRPSRAPGPTSHQEMIQRRYSAECAPATIRSRRSRPRPASYAPGAVLVPGGIRSDQNGPIFVSRRCSLQVSQRVLASGAGRELLRPRATHRLRPRYSQVFVPSIPPSAPNAASALLRGRDLAALRFRARPRTNRRPAEAGPARRCLNLSRAAAPDKSTGSTSIPRQAAAA